MFTVTSTLPLPWSDRLNFLTGEPQDLFLLFALFLFVCAFITVVCWLYFSGRSSAETGMVSGAGDSLATDSGTHSHTLQRFYRYNESGFREVAFDYDAFPHVGAASQLRSEHVYREAIDKGWARYDEAYSIVLLHIPENKDDLTLIQGLDEARQQHLYDLGCYTYEQISSWSHRSCRILANEMRCHEALYRGDWLGQARALHLEKYGERI